MRKPLFIILLVMLVSGLYGQEFKFMGGVSTSKYKTGDFTLSLFSIDSYYSWDYKSGILIGVGFEYPLIKKTAIEIDVFYFQKGGRIEMPDVPNYERNYFLDMISLPILTKVEPLDFIPIYILGGGEFSFILSHKCEIIFEDNIIRDNITWKKNLCWICFWRWARDKACEFFSFCRRKILPRARRYRKGT
jgi:hypothetical protein